MPAPLSDKDYQRLSATLTRLAPQGAMSLEHMDGFFTALLAGPEALSATATLPLVLGPAFDDHESFTSVKALEQFVDLVGRHWRDIADTLRNGAEFQPWLEEDAAGEVRGNDWAEGFSAGMQLFNDDWAEVFDHPQLGEALAPIMALAFERDHDPEMRPFLGEVDEVRRAEWLGAIGPAVSALYGFFSARRAALAAEYGDD